MNFKLKWQDAIIYLILAIIGGVITALPTFPSMDGAAHLYNAQILHDYLIQGHASPFAQHFVLNPIPVPNWYDHLVLAFLLLVFKPLFAQKLFMILSVFVFVILFNQLGKKNNTSSLTLVILPVVFSFFYFTGLYNQHWSYIVLVAYLLYLSKSDFQIQTSFKFYWSLFLFSILFWMTSIMGYAVFLLITGCLSVFYVSEGNKLALRFNWKQIGIITLLVLPSVVLTFWFVLATPMSNAEPHISLFNRFIGLFHLDFIKLYNMGGETYFLAIIGLIYAGLLVILVKQLYVSKKIGFLIILGTLFLAAVFIPNQAGAGMLSTRLAMYFWVVALVLIKHFAKNHKQLFLASGLVFVCFFFITNKKYNTHIKRLGNLGHEVYQLGSVIGTSETVLSLNETEDYYIGHLLDYASIKNKAINVSNYEANYPWFPIQWNRLNKECKRIDELWKQGKKNDIIAMKLDWILVYGPLSGDTENEVNKNYTLHSSLNQVRLFQHK